MATDAELKQQITTTIKNKTPQDQVQTSEHGALLDEFVDSKLNKADVPTIPPAPDTSGIQTNANAITALTTRVGDAETNINTNETNITANTAAIGTKQDILTRALLAAFFENTEGNVDVANASVAGKLKLTAEELDLPALYTLVNNATAIDALNIADVFLVLDESEGDARKVSAAAMRQYLGGLFQSDNTAETPLDTSFFYFTLADGTQHKVSGANLKTYLGSGGGTTGVGNIALVRVAPTAGVTRVRFRPGGLDDTTWNIPITGNDEEYVIEVDSLNPGINEPDPFFVEFFASRLRAKTRYAPGNSITDANSLEVGAAGVANVHIRLGLAADGSLYMGRTGGGNTIGDAILYKKQAQGVAPGPQPTPFEAPSISDFSISGLDPNNPPAAGSALGGQRTVSFTVQHPENVSGNLTLSQQTGSAAASNVSTTIDPEDADGSVSITFPTLAAAAGTTYTYRLFGTDTENNTFERSFTIMIAAAHELAYFGAYDGPDEPTWATATLPTGDQVVDVQDENYTFETDIGGDSDHGIRANGNGYFYIMVPSNREPTAITGPAGNVLNRFTRRPMARTIGTQNYTVFFQHNQNNFAILNLFTVTRRP